MAVANQKLIMIDKTKTLSGNFLRIDNDFIINANKRLTPTGFRVYLYLVTRAPNTFDGCIPNEKKGGKPYELSPEDISKTFDCNKRAVQKAIEEMIAVGYLKLMSNGYTYQFRDFLPEDHVITHEERIEIKDYMNESLAEMKAEKSNQLHDIAHNEALIQFEQEQQKTQEHHYDWE